MSGIRLIFERQWIHAMLLAILLYFLVEVSAASSVRAGQLWGIGTNAWIWTAVGVAVAHQGLVWFCWRTQLHASLLTRALGNRGFVIYAWAFSFLGIARVAAVVLLAVSNRGTVPIAPHLSRALAMILAIPCFYLFYSVHRYFGFRRAFGIDHFDPAFRIRPMVREGIFRFTRNGMYVFGFFILWIPGLWYQSTGALWIAGFNHVYIWVHYFTTELPDMRRIYRHRTAFGPGIT